MESLRHFEMLYDCEHCGTQGLLAKSQRCHCAECGAPQNPDKRYIPKEGEAKIVDTARSDLCGGDRGRVDGRTVVHGRPYRDGANKMT